MGQKPGESRGYLISQYDRLPERPAGQEPPFMNNPGKSRRFPPDICRRAARKLEQLDLATTLTDLKVPPSNRLHALSDDRKGQHSMSINDQWRICFRFADGDAFDVEVCDYH